MSASAAHHGSDETFDVVVVGLGPGGEELAGRLAQAGLAVAGVEGRLVGGECPYWGCVPSKMMIRAANLLAEGRRIDGMAGRSTVEPDWAPVARRIRDEATDDWNDVAAARRLESKGATLVRGWGRLDGPGMVVVGERRLRARRAVVLNPGTKSWAPPVPGLAEVPYWTNREAIETERVPASLAVLGGGAIGLELGQVFARFGSSVTVVEVADRLLAMEEPESSSLIGSVLDAEGVAVRTSAQVGSVERDSQGVRIRLEGADDVVAERLLVAAGRRADLAALGLASVGIDETGRAVVVDPTMRAGPGLWAIGDVTGVGAFTHVSMYQAAIAAADILGQNPPGADYRALPRVTFTDPEIGSAGLTEAAARAEGRAVRTAFSPLADSTRGWIHKVGNDGFVKLVADTDRRVLVGATAAGPSGGEVLGLLALAVHAEVPLDRLRSMILAYPTFHRAIGAALDQLS
ncbi:MAG TPA: NAD(P)/FAD-dependent oxidoreductase [Acidimicrobiales bacterium]|jgi:pyruvate/2-oxoglutarate dehydrogenase complex dihydrolipoamide dehydrogenase (E3) component